MSFQNLARRVVFYASEAGLCVIRSVVCVCVYMIIAVCVAGRAVYRVFVGTDGSSP
jgi:hypothetical protein